MASPLAVSKIVSSLAGEMACGLVRVDGDVSSCCIPPESSCGTGGGGGGGAVCCWGMGGAKKSRCGVWFRIGAAGVRRSDQGCQSCARGMAEVDGADMARDRKESGAVGMGKLKGTVSFSSDRVDGELRLSDSCACRCAEVGLRLSPTPFGLVLRPRRIDAGRATVDTVPLDDQYWLGGYSSHAHMTVGQHDAIISSRSDSTRSHSPLDSHRPSDSANFSARPRARLRYKNADVLTID